MPTEEMSTVYPFEETTSMGGSNTNDTTFSEPSFEAPQMCPVTQRVIVISPFPSEMHELVRDLSGACYDVLVFHHWEQGIRNALAADLLIFDLTFCREGEEAKTVKSLLEQDIGDTPSLLLVKENMLLRLSERMTDRELLVWPARPQEIMYHTRRIIRNSAKQSPASRLLNGSSLVIYKDIWLDQAKMAVYRSGAEIELTKLEYDLLLELLSKEGNVLSRDQLLNEVWGTSYMGGSNVVDAHVKSLRKKLGDSAVNSTYITTVRGVGYRLAD